MQPSIDLERLQRLLGAPELARLRQRLRARYERGADKDFFTLDTLSAMERRALENLLGRATTDSTSMRLSHSELDAVFSRAQLAPDLRHALEALDGPIENRSADRLARERTWQSLIDTPHDQRVQALLSDPQGLGLLKRCSAGDPVRAQALIDEVHRVLERLPAQGMPLARLAAAALGDAHGLDAGRPVAALVLRAVAGSGFDDAENEERSDSAEVSRARDRWARMGITVNELAAPVLSLNLDAHGDSPGAQLVRLSRTAAEPVHVSLRTLRRATPDWTPLRNRDVFVCENPAVIAIAADRLGARCAPIVCTDGMPAAAQRILLQQLAAQGARLRYRGDYDWDGLRIGNFVMRTFRAVQWRFDARHFAENSSGRGRRLSGVAVGASWDSDLAPAMESNGFALEEETVIDSLLADLGD